MNARRIPIIPDEIYYQVENLNNSKWILEKFKENVIEFEEKSKSI